MSNLTTERVTHVHHWDDNLFSFRTSRDPSFRFNNGHFTMLGLEMDGRPLLRAYSIASANYEEELEFFSIKVPDGPLTSRLQHLQVGDELLLSRKPTGTLVVDNLLPGRNLFLVATGTGLAPFLSIVKDPDLYERFERVILMHGVRYRSELAYAETITEELPGNEYFGDQVRDKLIYYPSVTRESFHTRGRVTDLMSSGKLYRDLDLEPFDLASDRFMICGSPAMLKDACALLDGNGFSESRRGVIGHYVIERAFVES